MVFSNALLRLCVKELPKTLSKNKIVRNAKEQLKGLSGFFGIIKERAVSVEDVLLATHLSFQDELGCNIEKTTMKRLIHGSHLSPMSRGVIVCYIGSTLDQKRLFDYSEKHYHVVIKLGTETETFCSLGKVIDEKSYDHVTKKKVIDALQNHCGKKLQIAAPYYMLPKYIWFKDAKREEFKLLERKQPNEVELFEAVCTNFKAPFIKLDIRTDGSFNVERFTSDLGKDLNTCAHVVDLERTAYSVFNLSNSLPSYKWYKKYIEEEIAKNKDNVYKSMGEISQKYKAQIQRDQEEKQRKLQEKYNRG